MRSSLALIGCLGMAVKVANGQAACFTPSAADVSDSHASR